jgi:hypothetical protein
MLIVGLLISIVFGCILNVVFDLMGTSTNSKPLAALVGIIPGLLFVGWGLLVKRGSNGFATGLLVGGCIVALIGGACGAAMTPFNIR